MRWLMRFIRNTLGAHEVTDDGMFFVGNARMGYDGCLRRAAAKRMREAYGGG